ncbi:hypothetical protein T492DRAFT_839346 [Pavlovales sp. CCMP2436]|nr:hypothetical protein T492DRAFT_839346 [Pavlovales sp. CCMP2436]
MAPRVAVITNPEQATLVSLWPYSQTANGIGFVKMTENVQGKMDSDIGRVIWTKKLPCYKDTLNLGSTNGNFATAFSQVVTGSSAVGSISQVQCGRRTMMEFSIKVAKEVYDNSAVSSVESAFPKYRLFMYQENCVGFPQVNSNGTAPTVVLDNIVSFMRFVDP